MIQTVSVVLTLIAWLDPLKSLVYEFRIPKFTLVTESILSNVLQCIMTE